jgi:hypothetical protein
VKEPGEAARASNTPIGERDSSTVRREPNAVYQGERVVARVLNAEVDLKAKEVRFEELYESDYLLLPEECDYQSYKIMVQRVAYATKAPAGTAQRGRLLKGVVADILGYQDQ